MAIENKLLNLRIIARSQGKYVMNKLFDDYLTGLITKRVVSSCILCGSEENLTKEHVLPRWVFQRNSNYTFKTDVNQLSQTYIGATLPFCMKCNNDILNGLEQYIQKSFSKVNLKTTFYSSDQWINIIRWLETIDFKFQVLDIITKFKAHKEAGYIPALADFSIAFMRDMSIRSVTSKARSSLKRISTKNKSKMFNSLIVGTTKVKTFHYFHKSGEFIYLEIPTYNKCFFYFFQQEFKNGKDAEQEAMRIIKSVYE